ncbi:hypothetical protein S40285_02467 [Stachybotrys chlorohalonatus IBT 40285]|uniref:Protein YAE1 n=1 Tax=Stachybotrys chlorohalonatus (strain IBT 40285) TaxID=1283841 RepID=A0A084R0P4_STAC4|nr:hypothetical protein S40285_02467 [Stachybotrys chlorohalonata IBT 40285]
MHFQSSERPDEDTHFTRAGGDFVATRMASNDPLDDVFGSGPASPAAEHEPSVSHPSDMHRLRTEHTTAGYREGVTAAKETSIQAGFDEGFSLGATIGLKAGQLLGTIEGIAEAVRADTGKDAAKTEALLSDAREDLSKPSIFSPDYWSSDGNWKFDVPAEGGQEEVVFSDVASAHPLVRKWTEIVHEQVQAWKIDVLILDDDNSPRLEAVSDEHGVTSQAASVRQPLEW